MHNFTECQNRWRKNFLPQIRYVATIPCESLGQKSNTFHTILALRTCLYRSHLRKPVSMKQNTAESQRLKICVQNVHHLREQMHSNDYATAQSLPRWCGPAASTRSADVLSTPSHHESANSRPSLKGYRRCCSPLDLNLSNLSPHLWRDKLLAFLSAAWWQCHVHGERHDFSDVNITSPGKGCTWHAT